ERGLAEAVWERGRKRWRVSEAGFAVLQGSIRITDTPQPATSPAPPEFHEPLVRRLAEVVGAYNRQDLRAIDVALSPDVLMFGRGGLIVEGIIQPDDQTAFDRAVGAA